MDIRVTTTTDNREWYERVIREYRLKGYKPAMLIERADYKFDRVGVPAYLGYQPVVNKVAINGKEYTLRVVKSGFCRVFKP